MEENDVGKKQFQMDYSIGQLHNLNRVPKAKGGKSYPLRYTICFESLFFHFSIFTQEPTAERLINK